MASITVNSLSVYEILEYFDDYLWQLEDNFTKSPELGYRDPRKAAERSMKDCLGDFGEIPTEWQQKFDEVGLDEQQQWKITDRLFDLALKVHFGKPAKFTISVDFYKGA